MPDRLWGDLRLAARTLRREPRYAASVAVTAAIGIAGAALVTSFALSVALFPLPYRHLSRLATVLETTRADCPQCVDAVTEARYQAWRTASRHSVAALAQFTTSNSLLVIGEDTVRTSVASVSDAFFPVLGTTPIIGSIVEFSTHGGAVISNDAWRHLFGGTSNILGKLIKINGTVYPIAGVMPQGFGYPARTTAWIPLSPSAVASAGDIPAFTVVAQMSPGASLPQVRQELGAVVDPAEASVAPRARRGVAIFSLESSLRGQSQGPIGLLMGTLGLIFLIGCTSVAGLVLTRSVGRRQELAVRQVLGATQVDFLRLLCAEVAVLVAVGGIVGGGAALLLSNRVASIVEGRLGVPLWFNVSGTLVGTTIVLTLCVAVIVSALTVPTLLRLDRIEALRESGYTATAGSASMGLRRILAGAQIVVSIVLLGSAALLGRSYSRGLTSNLGYRGDSLYVTDVTLDTRRAASQGAVYAAAEEVHGALRAANGLSRSQVWSWVRPHLFQPGAETIVLDAKRRAPVSGVPVASYDVDSGFFAFMGIHLLRGRLFRAADNASSSPVVVVNEVAATRLWPHQDPLGQRFRLGPREATTPWMTVVGVVSNSQPIASVGAYLAATDESRFFPLMWRPLAQVLPWHLVVGVRAARPDQIHGQDAIEDLRTIWKAAPPPLQPLRGEMMNEWPFPEIRANAVLLAGWSIYGAILAVFGAAALAADSVRRRHREIGIRMALGATGRQIVAQFCREAAGMVGVAAVVAVLGFVTFEHAFGRIFFGITQANPTGLLLGVSTLDPVLALVVGLLVIFVVGATFLAARRAADVDPARTTRTL